MYTSGQFHSVDVFMLHNNARCFGKFSPKKILERIERTEIAMTEVN